MLGQAAVSLQGSQGYSVPFSNRLTPGVTVLLCKAVTERPERETISKLVKDRDQQDRKSIGLAQ